MSVPIGESDQDRASRIRKRRRPKVIDHRLPVEVPAAAAARVSRPRRVRWKFAGIDVRNAGTTMAGRRIAAEIVENEYFGPRRSWWVQPRVFV